MQSQVFDIFVFNIDYCALPQTEKSFRYPLEEYRKIECDSP